MSILSENSCVHCGIPIQLFEKGLTLLQIHTTNMVTKDSLSFFQRADGLGIGLLRLMIP
ncbi:hypothetical protein [Bacillus sp. 2205SS5-2]|uniref:hypothetical protein n=1 Tax=Bacillus sp. 2205SS5-2 TaxID=3109031 RepID=UPI003004B643